MACFLCVTVLLFLTVLELGKPQVEDPYTGDQTVDGLSDSDTNEQGFSESGDQWNTTPSTSSNED